MTSTDFIVGLTGGIASGKSSVASIFSSLGVPVVDLDDVARLVVAPNSPALEQIKAEFGSEIITTTGELNRAKLRRLIFGCTQKKAWLERLLHPLILRKAFSTLEDFREAPYAILVAPLLFETQLEKKLDHVIVVDANETLQILRTTERDQVSTEEAKSIIDQQMSRDARLAKADSILENKGGIEDLSTAVKQLHNKLLKLSRFQARPKESLT